MECHPAALVGERQPAALEWERQPLPVGRQSSTDCSSLPPYLPTRAASEGDAGAASSTSASSGECWQGTLEVGSVAADERLVPRSMTTGPRSAAALSVALAVVDTNS